MDTAAKRKSAIGIGLLCLRLGVIADGSDLSAAQRSHAAFQYSGIAADSPVVETAASGYAAWQSSVMSSGCALLLGICR